MDKNDRIVLFNDAMKGKIPKPCEKWLDDRGYFEAPASTKYHGSYEGGLFDHSLNVLMQLLRLTEENRLKWQREQSPYIIGMFHALCKIDQYKHPIVDSMETYYGVVKPLYDNLAWEFNDDTFLVGHGDKSVMLLSELMQLTEEEIFCIRYHMGAFTDKEEWKYYTKAIHKYENVLWVHHADMLASHVIEK